MHHGIGHMVRGGRWSCPDGGGNHLPPRVRGNHPSPPPGYIRELWSMGGRYASYWNAFLLFIIQLCFDFRHLSHIYFEIITFCASFNGCINKSEFVQLS